MIKKQFNHSNIFREEILHLESLEALSSLILVYHVIVESLEPVLQLPSEVVIGSIVADTPVTETATALDPVAASEMIRQAGHLEEVVLAKISAGKVVAIITTALEVLPRAGSTFWAAGCFCPGLLFQESEVVLGTISAGVIVAITATALAVAEAMFTSRVAGVFVQLGEVVLAENLFAIGDCLKCAKS